MAQLAQLVFWIMGQRVGPEPDKAWVYVAGPFNSYRLADAYAAEHLLDPPFTDFCALRIVAKRVWRS